MGACRYHIKEVVGRGGFGSVYRAVLEGDDGFRKEVAVKLLRDGVASEAASRHLRREARLLGLLRHRTILQVHGLVRLDGSWAIVTEYVPGANLHQIARHGRVPACVMLEIAADAAGALHAAWSGRGPDGRALRLVHRDVKPSNIQISTAGEVKLLDFGIARVPGAANDGIDLGTRSYLAPERWMGRDGPAADTYALGLVFCEAVTRRRWPPAVLDPAVHAAHVRERLALVREVAGPGHEPVAELLARMLAYDPDDRPCARDVERSCRELRSRARGPWLADWADEVVPRVRTTVYDDPRGLSSRLVFEDDPSHALSGWLAAVAAGGAAAMLVLSASLLAVGLLAVGF